MGGPVRPVGVAVIDILIKDQPQVPVASDKHPVQVLAPRCQHAAEVRWSVRPADTSAGSVTVACHLYDQASSHPDRIAPGPTPAGSESSMADGHRRTP